MARLAEAHSPIALVVSVPVKPSLWRLERAVCDRSPAAEGALDRPTWVPFAGFAVSLGVVLWGLVGLAGPGGSPG